MILHRNRHNFILFMAGVIVFSAALFCLCYQLDNKYTKETPQAIGGVLLLDSGIPEDSSIIFLTHGWEIYRDKLLAPEDFATSAVSPDEYVYIGQYGGFEGGDYTRSPHGSATYRMNIIIPDESATYTLELPEIYSAYRLYINGRLSEQFGDPDPEDYRPQTGNAAISFAAQDNIEIIIAVADYSHTYSGMVYPPAFGASAAVSSMLGFRLTLRAAVCAVAVALALFFLTAGAFMRRNRAMLLFGLLCLCFVGYTCYPVVKTIIRGGLAWYGFENLCFAFMLLLVMLLQRTITGDKGKLSKAFVLVGAAVCGAYAIRFFLPLGDLRVLAVYSLLTGLYKWAAALFLTVSMIRSAGKSTRYGYTMLAGVLVFDCALIMDRLLPLYEPILFGWFTEIAGFSIVLTLGIVMGQEVIRQYRDKLALEGKIAGIESLVAMQQSYYPVILEGVEETRRARHDLRHHLSIIGGLVSSGNQQELERYLGEYSAGMDNLSPLNYCENYVVDVILRHFSALCAAQGVHLTVNARIPETLAVTDADTLEYKVVADGVSVTIADTGWTTGNASGADVAVTAATDDVWVRVKQAGSNFKSDVYKALDSVTLDTPALIVPVTNTGGTGTATYAGATIDLSGVSSLFTVDTNAGARTYIIDGGTGTGTINIDNKTLTVTKAGTFTIGLVTAATGTHAAGAKVTATLTVNKGAQSAPTGLNKADATTNGGTDGKITGLTASTNYAYKKDSGGYTLATSNGSGEITGLAAGSYVVRLAATDLYNDGADSAAVVISLPAATYTATLCLMIFCWLRTKDTKVSALFMHSA